MEDHGVRECEAHLLPEHRKMSRFFLNPAFSESSPSRPWQESYLPKLGGMPPLSDAVLCADGNFANVQKDYRVTVARG